MGAGNVAGGMLDAFSKYITGERERRRKSEDDSISEQSEIIQALMSRPDANPALLGRALHDMLELSGAKVNRKFKRGGEGFMGSSELPISQFLQGIQDGSTPMVGRTTEDVYQGGMEHAVPELVQPVNPQQIPGRAFFDGQSVLNEPIMVPPTPLAQPPNSMSRRMLDAANSMKRTQPVQNQPLLIDPNEMAERAGRAEGQQYFGRTMGTMDAKQKILSGLGKSDGEIADALTMDMMGSSANPYQLDTTPQIFEDPTTGERIMGIMKMDRRTGSISVTDQNGLPIPPNFQPANTSASGQNNTTEEDFIAAYAHRLGTTPTLLTDRQRLAARKEWMQVALASILVNPASGMTPQQAPIFNGAAAQYRNSAPVKAVARTAPLRGAIQRIRATPANAMSQLSLIYGFVQALDTYQSTVREGEIAISRETMSRVEQLKTSLASTINGRLISPENALLMAQEAESIVEDISAEAAAAEQVFRSQMIVNGLLPQWNSFISGAGVPVNANATIPEPPQTGVVQGAGLSGIPNAPPTAGRGRGVINQGQLTGGENIVPLSKVLEYAADQGVMDEEAIEMFESMGYTVVE